MAWTTYKGLTVPSSTSGEAGGYLSSDLEALADRVGPCNFTATSNPTSGDDATDGYEVGSFWVNTATNTWFVCVNNTPAAAAWGGAGGASLPIQLPAVDPVFQVDSSGNQTLAGTQSLAGRVIIADTDQEALPPSLWLDFTDAVLTIEQEEAQGTPITINTTSGTINANFTGNGAGLSGTGGAITEAQNYSSTVNFVNTKATTFMIVGLVNGATTVNIPQGNQGMGGGPAWSGMLVFDDGDTGSDSFAVVDPLSTTAFSGTLTGAGAAAIMLWFDGTSWFSKVIGTL